MTIHDYWKLDGWIYVGHVLMNSAIDALCHYVFESCLFIVVHVLCKLGPKRCNNYARETPISFGPLGIFFRYQRYPP